MSPEQHLDAERDPAGPVASAANTNVEKPMTKVSVSIPGGDAVGVADGKIQSFFSLPYAAPPVGPLKFAPPAPVKAWDGDRDATRPGPVPPQTRTTIPGVDLDSLMGPAWAEGDHDYLTLNVWRPNDKRTGLPVMVWIHGGGFINGSKDVPITDGTAFARDGIVCVAINYRLGIEGFLPIPGVPTNLGLRDQIASLAWVRDNIGGFGGDPANVTVFGESAGAVSVACLLASPLAKGLFRRAILQSGHGAFGRPIEIAQRAVRKLAKKLGVTPDADGFRSVSTEKGLAGQDWLGKTRIDLRDASGVEAAFAISRFLPVFGDDVLPVRPDRALLDGASADIEMLIGTNSEELNLMLVVSGMKDKIGRLLAVYVMHQSFPNARRILKAYGLGKKGVTPGQALGDAATDMVFREPARRFAAAHKGKTHFYEFGWRSTAFGGEAGAGHALEMPFVFDTLKCAEAVLGPNPPQKLADDVHRLWVGYAVDGTLPWDEFDATTRQVYHLETGTASPEALLPAAALLP